MATYATKLRQPTGKGAVGIDSDLALQLKNNSSTALADVAQVKVGSTTKAENVLPVPVTHSAVVMTIGSDAEALTLANGIPGQLLVVTLGTAGGGAGTLTPVTATGWATAIFTVVGDGATFLYVDDTVGWLLIGAYGTTSSTAGTVITL